MEIFELKYFNAVAACENIHEASQRLGVSPSSLSKAVTKLEEELHTPLFKRHGRNIRLTDGGRWLKGQALKILQLEEATRLDLSGGKNAFNVTVVGSEILLSHFGKNITLEIGQRYPTARFHFQVADEDRTLALVRAGEGHIGLLTDSADDTVKSRIIGEVLFKICVGEPHPLYRLAKNRRSIAVEKVLDYPFVSPTGFMLGRVGDKQSPDGWRDDQFPRRIQFSATSLSLITDLVCNGRALAYLPDYYAAQIPVLPLILTDCPYRCAQKVRMIATRHDEYGWLKRLFADA